jgi:hypothetical protein
MRNWGSESGGWLFEYWEIYSVWPTMKPPAEEQPLTPALSPPAFVGLRRGTKGERENHSLVLQDANGLDFRSPLVRGPNARKAVQRILTTFLSLNLMALSFGLSAQSVPQWEFAFREMPLRSVVTELNRTNCVAVMLAAFQSNAVVKALIFMPGATDEFYMFRRAHAALTNATPSLLDALVALTNQTLIRATFRPPFLLLHTDEDPLEPVTVVKHQKTADKLQRSHFVPHGLYDDRDWDFLQPILKKKLHVDVMPWRFRNSSWHFYRHSFACWGLNGWEALNAAALAGKTKFTVEHNRVVFEPDARFLTTPKFEVFPR